MAEAGILLAEKVPVKQWILLIPKSGQTTAQHQLTNPDWLHLHFNAYLEKAKKHSENLLQKSQ